MVVGPAGVAGEHASMKQDNVTESATGLSPKVQEITAVVHLQWFNHAKVNNKYT